MVSDICGGTTDSQQTPFLLSSDTEALTKEAQEVVQSESDAQSGLRSGLGTSIVQCWEYVVTVIRGVCVLINLVVILL